MVGEIRGVVGPETTLATSRPEEWNSCCSLLLRCAASAPKEAFFVFGGGFFGSWDWYPIASIRRVYFELSPGRRTVTTRDDYFLGDSCKPSFATVTGIFTYLDLKNGVKNLFLEGVNSTSPRVWYPILLMVQKWGVHHLGCIKAL